MGNEEKLRIKNLEEMAKKRDQTIENLHEKLDKQAQILVRIETSMVTQQKLQETIREHEKVERRNFEMVVSKEDYQNDKGWVRSMFKGAYALIGILILAVSYIFTSKIDHIEEEIKILSDKLDNMEINVYAND